MKKQQWEEIAMENALTNRKIGATKGDLGGHRTILSHALVVL